MRLAISVAVGLLLQFVKAGPYDCPSTISELGICDQDEGPIYPRDGQAVYLRKRNMFMELEGWIYPKASGYLSHGPHPERSITDTEESWATWIWHDCEEGYVCLESGKYTNYYLYTGEFANGIEYSSDPKDDSWFRLKAWVNYTKFERHNYRFISKILTDRTYMDNEVGVMLSTYIPPRCEGFKLILNIPNCSTKTIKQEYSYEQGVTQYSKSISTITVGISHSLLREIISGIVSASLGYDATFSSTWVQEEGISKTEKTVIKTTIDIPPGKRLFIYQKAATYGGYIWRSSKQFLYCTKDVGSECN